ncbi:hypothetical protein DER46DRAFT_611516 [Fusarium sp. MPI-SDFR-AT-0072]|nr:hypothetical protein DER46DRAFT_611516 [Fusarium sp. MPI-SDFR-AT-0072]
MTVLTYNDGNYGSISLFQLWREPDRIRPVAAMDYVPKFVLKTIYSCTDKKSKLELRFRNGAMDWNKRYLSKNDGPFLCPVPNKNRNRNVRCPAIGTTLKSALKQDPLCTAWESFLATIPQMVAALHLRTSLLQNIESTQVQKLVYRDQDIKPMPERGVTLLRGPSASGHHGHNVRIAVLSPKVGEWAKEKLAWT